MPKLKQSEKEAANELLIALINKNMTLKHIRTYEELAGKMGFCPATMYAKRNNPDKFTRGELWRLFRVLGFSREEKEAVL